MRRTATHDLHGKGACMPTQNKPSNGIMSLVAHLQRHTQRDTALQEDIGRNAPKSHQSVCTATTEMWSPCLSSHGLNQIVPTGSPKNQPAASNRLWCQVSTTASVARSGTTIIMSPNRHRVWSHTLSEKWACAHRSLLVISPRSSSFTRRKEGQSTVGITDGSTNEGTAGAA
jgi:hypothetical protein